MTTSSPVPRGDVRAELRLVGSTPTFTDAPATLLADMVALGHVVRIRRNWAMLSELTPADKAYVLLEGEVDVRRGRADLGRCRPGEFLGELGIMQRRLRTATVVAATDLIALHLGRAEFERLHAAHPYFRTLVGEAMLRKTA